MARFLGHATTAADISTALFLLIQFSHLFVAVVSYGFYWNFDNMLLLLPATRLIVHRYSWCALRTNFVSNDFIIIIYFFSVPVTAHTFISLPRNEMQKNKYLAQPSFFLRMGIFNCDAAYRTWLEILSATIEITPFKRYYSQERKRKKKTKPYSNFGTVENCLAHEIRVLFKLLTSAKNFLSSFLWCFG